MKKEEIKNCLDAVEPQAAMKTRMQANVAAKQATRKPQRTAVKAAVAVVLCLVLTAGVLAYDLYGAKTASITPVPCSETGPAYYDRIPGGVLFAYAQNGEEKETMLTPNLTTMPTKTRLLFRNLNGLSEEEAAAAEEEMRLLSDNEWYFINDNHINAYISHYRTGNVIHMAAQHGHFMLDFTEEELANLAQIHIVSESEWMQFCYDSASQYYGEALRFDGSMESPEQVYLEDEITLSGDAFRTDCHFYEVQPSAVHMPPGTYSYEAKEAFWEMLNDHPDYVITDLTDTLHFEVTFMDGSFTECVVQIAFNEEGYMQITPKIYRHEGEPAEENFVTETVTATETITETETSATELLSDATETTTSESITETTAPTEEISE